MQLSQLACSCFVCLSLGLSVRLSVRVYGQLSRLLYRSSNGNGSGSGSHHSALACLTIGLCLWRLKTLFSWLLKKSWSYAQGTGQDFFSFKIYIFMYCQEKNKEITPANGRQGYSINWRRPLSGWYTIASIVRAYVRTYGHTSPVNSSLYIRMY